MRLVRPLQTIFARDEVRAESPLGSQGRVSVKGSWIFLMGDVDGRPKLAVSGIHLPRKSFLA